jgi:glycosyltransferase involved in cell wall biosynthesis
LDTASPILICVGRIERSKGQRYWLPVLADILNDWPDACLMLVGDGPDEKLIGETAQELGIRHAVKMLGRRDDVPALLDISDIFVSASLTEGFGIAVLEAMAAGKPVVALHLPALSEFVQDGRTGFLVPVLSAEAFSEKLRAILSDPALQGKMEAAAKDAARHFTVQRSARQIEGVYQRVVERRTA